MKYIAPLAFLVFICSVSKAQQADSTVKPAGKTNFIIGITGNSALNYYGRTDSLKSRALYPFAGVVFKNGLYLSGTAIFINNNASSTQYAATIAEAGYQFSNEKKNWSGSVSGNYFIYQDNSNLPQSALKGMTTLSLSNLNRIVNLNFSGNVKFSDNADFGAAAGLDHAFRIDPVGKKGVIVIDPSAYAYAGTQRFTASFYQQKNFLIFPAGQQAVTTESQKFNLLSYEFSAPIIYGIGTANFILTPAYVVPENLVKIPGNAPASETGSPLFYLSATIKCTL